MPDLFDTSNIRDEPAQWDALAERVTARAIERAGTFDQIAQSRASWLAAAIAAAVAAVLLLRPAAAPAGAVAAWAGALTPSDSLGRTIIGHSTPPAIGALLLGEENSGGAR